MDFPEILGGLTNKNICAIIPHEHLFCSIPKGGDVNVQGDPMILVREFSKSFCIFEAMDAAGYKGAGRIYDAVRDIHKHAHILKHELGGSRDAPQIDKRLERIIGEYERIAFDRDDDGIRIADRLKALDVYRALSAEAGDGDADKTLIINYDYGDGE